MSADIYYVCVSKTKSVHGPWFYSKKKSTQIKINSVGWAMGVAQWWSTWLACVRSRV